MHGAAPAKKPAGSCVR